jgi:hypothetical protein
MMPNVIIGKLFLFVEGLIKACKHSFEHGNAIVLCIVEEIGLQNCSCSSHCNGMLTTPPKITAQIGRHENQDAFK